MAKSTKDSNKIKCPQINKSKASDKNEERGGEEGIDIQHFSIFRFASIVLPILTHILAFAVYLIPLYFTLPVESDAVLDEIHIMGPDFADVRGTGPLIDLIKNDYWGRPMMRRDSHKSWRPFSILTFRWINSYSWGDKDGNILKMLFRNRSDHHIFFHRFVSVMIHATMCEMVSIVSCKLLPSKQKNGWEALFQRTLTKIICALHPVHVEAVANTANRPHIIALLISMVVVDDRTNIVFLFIAYAIGLASAETFIFQMPAIVLSMILIHWWKHSAHTLKSLQCTFKSLIPRIFIIFALTACYLGGRYYFNTLEILHGLIRKAENAFFDLEGLQRYLSFFWVTSIHIGKAFTIDPIGPAHEYGFDCVKPLNDFNDFRLIYPFGIVGLLLVSSFISLRRGLLDVMIFLVFSSWVATLFPICGIVRIGTFIADRLAVAASFAFCAFFGKTCVIIGRYCQRKSQLIYTFSTIILIYIAICYKRVHKRTYQWTNNISLLESGLRTCPRSAKSNLEMSKIYSGKCS